MAKVRLANVSKSFGTVDIIKGLDLEIEDREFVVFVGPSGCGKSTLLRMIAGLEEITAGRIEIGGAVVNDLPPAQRKIAMVFQSYALYPHKTVRENIGFGLRMARADRATIERKVGEAARVLGLEGLLDRRPKALSGGQRQRVAIGRAIVRDPQLFLFDEPLSNLDAALRGQMRIEIARLHQTLDATMIYVTHDQVEAMTLADKIVVLNAGRIEQVGSPLDLYDHPSSLFVATFIGSPRMNLLTGRIVAHGPGVVEVVLDCGATCTFPTERSAERGAAVTLGIRPHDLSRDASQVVFEGEAVVVEHLGAETQVLLQLANGDQVMTCLGGRTPIRVGDRVRVGALAEDLHLFDASGHAIDNARRPRGTSDSSRSPPRETTRVA